MQTVYAATENFVRREGNVIDFAEYRSRMVPEERPVPELEEKWALLEWDPDEWAQEDGPSSRTRRHARRGWTLTGLLDVCATAALAVSALVVTGQLLLG